MTAPAVFFYPSNYIQPVGYAMLVGILDIKTENAMLKKHGALESLSTIVDEPSKCYLATKIYPTSLGKSTITITIQH